MESINYKISFHHRNFRESTDAAFSGVSDLKNTFLDMVHD